MSTLWSKEVFAKNLKFYMEQADKNQKEMAEIVGVSAPTFNEWIKAKKYPRIDKIEILANYFGILKSDLIENKVTEDDKKNNDILANIVIRLRTDKDLMLTVEKLCLLDKDELDAINRMLDAFKK